MPYRGRLSFRVYEPKKPNKYFVKFVILSEASSGYVLEFEIYAGEGSTTHDTVMRLLYHFVNKGYRLYMDNFYNSVKLTEALLRVGIHTCGTLRLPRGAPKDLQKKAKGKLEKNEVHFRQKGDTGVLLWKDKKPVSLITNLHNSVCTTKNRIQKVKKRGQVRYIHETIKKPVAIEDYNHNMSGVDRFDQMISYYTFIRRSQKWTKIFYFYFI